MPRSRILHLATALAAASLLTVGGVSAAQGGGRLSVCQGDVQSLCAGVQQGGGRIGQCLKAHAAQVSPACKSAIAQAMAAWRQRKAASGTAAAPTH